MFMAIKKKRTALSEYLFRINAASFYRICVDLANRQMARTYRPETYAMIKSVLRSPGRLHFFAGCSSTQNAKTTFQAHNTLRDTGQSVRIKAEELFFSAVNDRRKFRRSLRADSDG